MSKIIETLITGIIGGIVSGLVVFLIQFLVERRKENEKTNEGKRLGKRTDKYIDEDFINNYLPGFLSLEKVIEDFGQPSKIFEDSVIIKWDNNKTRELTIYHYDFINAVIEFSTFKDESTIISVTTNSNFSKSHPVKFSFAFADKDVYFGEAIINDEILSNKTKFEKEMFSNWGYSAVQAKFFYREIKGLTFTYIVCDLIDTEKEILNKKVDQLCISVNEDVYPIIYFYDMK